MLVEIKKFLVGDWGDYCGFYNDFIILCEFYWILELIFYRVNGYKLFYGKVRVLYEFYFEIFFFFLDGGYK